MSQEDNSTTSCGTLSAVFILNRRIHKGSEILRKLLSSHSTTYECPLMNWEGHTSLIEFLKRNGKDSLFFNVFSYVIAYTVLRTFGISLKSYYLRVFIVGLYFHYILSKTNLNLLRYKAIGKTAHAISFLFCAFSSLSNHHCPINGFLTMLLYHSHILMTGGRPMAK
jgi:hypothetical protein